MALIRWSPEEPFLPSIVGRIADFFDAEGNWSFPFSKGFSVPAVNISETPEAYTLEVAAPGFSKDNFRLEIKNGHLVISGETKEEKKDEEKGKYTRCEFRYGSFSRAFALPDDVDERHIRAQYTDGILRVNLPKKETAANIPARSIAID